LTWIVSATCFDDVSMIETLSLLELATNSEVPCRNRAVG
jgi:hypothetical protein